MGRLGATLKVPSSWDLRMGSENNTLCVGDVCAHRVTLLDALHSFLLCLRAVTCTFVTFTFTFSVGLHWLHNSVHHEGQPNCANEFHRKYPYVNR